MDRAKEKGAFHVLEGHHRLLWTMLLYSVTGIREQANKFNVHINCSSIMKRFYTNFGVI
jgi:hypothetical protein